MVNKTLSDMAKFVESIDPMKPANLLRHAGLVDNGDGTAKISRPAPFAADLGPDQKEFLQRNQDALDTLRLADRIVKEAKTCQHCKYWITSGSDKYTRCTNIKLYLMMAQGKDTWLEPPPDFGCTLFEVRP